MQDYTLFKPANTAYTLSDPTKWQPLVIEDVPPYGGGGTGAPAPCRSLVSPEPVGRAGVGTVPLLHLLRWPG